MLGAESLSRDTPDCSQPASSFTSPLLPLISPPAPRSTPTLSLSPELDSSALRVPAAIRFDDPFRELVLTETLIGSPRSNKLRHRGSLILFLFKKAQISEGFLTTGG